MTNQVRHWDENYKIFCDHAFYTLALRIINKRHFVFPSHYIGQYGAYDAIRHLWVKSGLFPDLVKEESIIASRDHSLDDIERARLVLGEAFRTKHKIDMEATVVFLAP